MNLPQRTSTPASRLEALQSRHAALEVELFDGQKHLSSSDQSLVELKKKKLRLKEEIEGLRKAS